MKWERLIRTLILSAALIIAAYLLRPLRYELRGKENIKFDKMTGQLWWGGDGKWEPVFD